MIYDCIVGIAHLSWVLLFHLSQFLPLQQFLFNGVDKKVHKAFHKLVHVLNDVHISLSQSLASNNFIT